MAKASVAVTGANGFIGRTLCGQLLANGVSSRALVRNDAAASFVEHLPTLAVGEIGPSTQWTQALAGVQCVIHCAGRVHVRGESAANSLAAYREVNVAGTRRLGEHAVALGVRRLVYLSSIKVHGEATLDGRAFSHRDTPAPEDPYGLSKCEAERALLEIANKSSLEVVVVRLPLVYGPGVKANFLRLMKMVRSGVPLPLAGVTNRRSLVSIDNLVSLLMRCIDHPAAAGETFLVSDGHDLSTPELISALAQSMGQPVRMLPVPPALLRLGGRITGRIPDVERLIGSLRADIRHTCEILDWQPPVPVEEGLRRTTAAPF